jgi:hypothetical protein
LVRARRVERRAPTESARVGTTSSTARNEGV